MSKKKHSFVWDAGNTTKLWVKHQVRPYEVEESFQDSNAVITRDDVHSLVEDRYILLGKTRKMRLLYIVFTVRAGRIRPISARSANRKEVAIYEEVSSTKV